MITTTEIEPGDEMARKKGPTVQAFSGEKLRALREGKGMTRRALSDLSGITEQAILTLEHERSDPGSNTAARLAAALGVGIEELFE